MQRHWVRLTTACNNRCVFCLDADTPRGVLVPVEDLRVELARGRSLGAEWVVLSGGEASLHPAFLDVVSEAWALGYDRVQTITNGARFADRAFYRAAVDAGLGELTFSLHGHDEALHDGLTRTPGSFRKLVKALLRAVRDPQGPVVNVDICVNRQNVEHLGDIIELCAAAGVTEFDLLHLIPQANAYVHRDLLFYDLEDHLPALQKVFRLARHPRFVIWTNRFPPAWLEGNEDLLQDPVKLLDEVNGRRYAFVAYLDAGRPLDCRQPERCRHCFVEPFCTTLDRAVAAVYRGIEVWEGPGELPFGATWRAVDVEEMADLPDEPVEARVRRPGPVPARTAPLRLVASTVEGLEAWAGLDMVVELNRQTAAWLLAHPNHRVWLRQPARATLEEAREDVRDPRAFFEALSRPLPVSGLPACLAPGARLVAEPARLSADLFSDGRLDAMAVARHHVAGAWRVKSARCAACAVVDACDGLPIQMVRDQGLSMLRPLAVAPPLPARDPGLAEGRPPEAVAASLPGFGPPPPPPSDPLAG